MTLWSDGCAYQNRCSVLSSALFSFAFIDQITIFHKYLEVGHTHMECDSVHSTIETKRKQITVNLPPDYINIIQGARKKGEKELSILTIHSLKFKAVCDIESVKPSKEVGPPYVNDIHQFQYNPNGTLFVNLDYSDSD